MQNLGWSEAIKKVLAEQGEPMRTSEIAQAILDGNLRSKVGATPHTAVASYLSQEPLRSEVEKLDRGVFRYPPAAKEDKPVPSSAAQTPVVALEDTGTADVSEDERGLLNAFGLFWRRAEIDWAPSAPTMLGVQLTGSAAVDFSSQEGVYILYDGSRLVYVGRVTEPRMGKRLREHTRDRLSGRWDRFSWFGVRPVGANGELEDAPDTDLDADLVISTLEALLIEALEPPQNRRQGDGFAELEFIQQIDPNIEKARKKRLLAELSDNL
ncbi:HTH domain-containing protein [Curtobacterium sp. VKM Ac-1393]|uniref:HTH domain-containing protein n=1 Tax=Curtobacterium sp. VKM Ac-1393 TaxID=2783814 RepID=UPI002B27238B|nr:HTH domain-containing protein [Curtobacterium sp. VKM Ac-1393]